MRLLVATSNPHKLREIGQILTPLGLSVVSLAEVAGALEEPAEDGTTFAENARAKATTYAKATGLACLSEDSGLEVDALSGAPGVYSARYAGVGETRDQRDEANNQKLLRELARMGPAPRSARFVCAACLVDHSGRVLTETRGTFEGEIGTAPRGENGFGYDPLLWLPELGKTAAELSPEEKHARSHRGQAMRALARFLADHAAAWKALSPPGA